MTALTAAAWPRRPGRGSDKGNVIGDTINHGKAQYWKRGANFFYHCTLAKGENTLEAQVPALPALSSGLLGSESEGPPPARPLCLGYSRVLLLVW